MKNYITKDLSTGFCVDTCLAEYLIDTKTKSSAGCTAFMSLIETPSFARRVYQNVQTMAI